MNPTPRPMPGKVARQPRGMSQKAMRPECSQAASAWNLLRHGGNAPMPREQIFQILAKCRALRGTMKQAAGARAAGHEARAQHLEHRAKTTPFATQKERRERALDLARLKTRKNARKALPPRPIDMEQREDNIRGKNGSRSRRFATDPARQTWYATHRSQRFIRRLTKSWNEP